MGVHVGLAGDLEVFTLLADVGSFSAAGRRLDLAPSSVARITDRIEARLGVRLLLAVDGRAPARLLYGSLGRKLTDCIGALSDVTKTRNVSTLLKSGFNQ